MRVRSQAVKLETAARAKINLHLRVLGLRNDGYHQIRTLLQTLDLHDLLRAASAPASVVELAVTPQKSVAPDEENMVMGAARALLDFAGVDRGVKLELVKKIPVGAGLGGGSSDAAATLVLLNQLWALNLRPQELMAIATDLGSDVPFFLVGGLVLATGRGESIRTLTDLPSYGVVICTPPIEISSREVYHRHGTGPQLTSPRSDDRVEAFMAEAEDGGFSAPPWQELENDLESIVTEHWPEAGRALTELRALNPLHAAITGSGASSYAIFRDLETARVAAEGLSDIWNVQVTSTIGRERGRPTARQCENQEEFA